MAAVNHVGEPFAQTNRPPIDVSYVDIIILLSQTEKKKKPHNA